MGMNLDEISKLLGEITQGDWSESAIRSLLRHGRKNFGPWDNDEELQGGVLPDDDDAKFIAAAPTIIRDLVERVRLLKDALTEIKIGEVEVWDDGEEQIVLTNMDEEEMQKIAADALCELAAKEST